MSGIKLLLSKFNQKEDFVIAPDLVPHTNKETYSYFFNQECLTVDIVERLSYRESHNLYFVYFTKGENKKYKLMILGHGNLEHDLKNLSKNKLTAWPWLILNNDVNGYDTAWGAVVLEILIALPAKLDAILISVAFFIFGSFIKDTKLLTETLNDFDAYLTLFSFDFLETSDSNAWAIASNPADAFILFGADIKNSGIKKKLSGINNSLSKECFIPST